VRIAVIVGLLSAFLVGAPAGHARDKVFRAQLDSDAPREQLRTEVRRCGQPFACSRLVVRDGSRRQALTAFRQTSLPYGWSVGRARLIDFTGDGVPEIAYELGTVGGTVSSPTMFGVSQWTGTSARRIFDFRNGRDPEPGYAYVVFVVTRIVTGTGGLPEIETRESLHRTTDANCCPSAFRITRHRWDGTRIAPVPGSVRIEDA
jgi:hypothetical protein